MKYKCKYISGGGTEYDGGIWEMTETPKQIKWTMIEKPFFEPCHNSMTIRKFWDKRAEKNSEDDIKAGEPAFTTKKDGILEYIAYFYANGVARHWQDGTWTLYPQRAGTPYVMEEIKMV